MNKAQLPTPVPGAGYLDQLKGLVPAEDLAICSKLKLTNAVEEKVLSSHTKSLSFS